MLKSIQKIGHIFIFYFVREHDNGFVYPMNFHLFNNFSSKSRHLLTQLLF